MHVYEDEPVYDYQEECEDDNYKLIIKGNFDVKYELINTNLESQLDSNHPASGSEIKHAKEYTASISSSGILETRYFVEFWCKILNFLSTTGIFVSQP